MRITLLEALKVTHEMYEVGPRSANGPCVQVSGFTLKTQTWEYESTGVNFPLLVNQLKNSLQMKRLLRSSLTWLTSCAGTHQVKTRLSLLCYPFLYKPWDKNWMQLEASTQSPPLLCPTHYQTWVINQENNQNNLKKKIGADRRTPPPFPNKAEQTPGSFSSIPEAQHISHEWPWLGKGSLWGYGFAAAASTPSQWRQGASSACPAVIGNPLERTRSAKMTQKYSSQPLTLEHPSVSKGGVRFWQGSFRTAAFRAHGNHMRAVSRRAVADFGHPNDRTGFLYFCEAAWCCSLTWLSA